MPPGAKTSRDLLVVLDGRRHVTRQIYRQIRDAILGGRILAGEPLPSSRELAGRLGVSRNAVVVVYERLRAEGFLEAMIGAGTFVSDDVRPRAPGPTIESPLRPRPLWDELSGAPDMSAAHPDFDFRPGVPDAARFPWAPWRARVSRQLRRGAAGAGAHIGAAGHPDLRAAIARHVGISRGVRAAPEDVFVTNGSQQAIDLVARVLLEPGDLVALEDPGYPPARRAFQAHGCRVAGAQVDDEGLVPDAIPAGARLVYVTPSHQYPLGMAMSMARRQALLDWAQRTEAAIVEDDYDSEFRYGGRPLEPLRSLDATGRVLFLGSFSKVLLPTLRLGFAVVPEPLHAAFAKAKAATDWHTLVPIQAAVAQLIDDGLLAQHVRRMRSVYAERHDRITRLLVRDFAGHLTLVPAAGGLHLSAFLHGRPASADVAITERVRALGVALTPLSYHFVATEPRAGLLIGYGAIPSDRIEEGLARVRACL
ncbi:MAG TPA: PLP-dependent aminotransferase family protein [Thermoanaerobaculia bacterium]|nr:PLP-dependent aminotransferase family protein [Thermoanaerobaculia bacterium]